MNKKQFVILLGFVVVLGLWGFNQWRARDAAWRGPGGTTAAGQKLLGDFDLNAVAQLAISQGTNELVLAKKNDLWRVAQRGDYPANFADLSSLLVKLKDLKVVQTEPIGAAQLPRLELAPGGANPPTVVEFRSNEGKSLQRLTLGKKHMKSGGDSSMGGMDGDAGWPDGRYVQVGETKDSVAVVSDPLTDLEPDAKRWLKKDFIKVEKPKSIAVTFPEATNSWTLTRDSEAATWTLTNPQAEEKLDTSKSSAVTSPFTSASITDVALGLTPEQAGLDRATNITITTFDGFEYVVRVGAKTNDNYLVAVKVTASLPKERVAAPDEKPEDKAKADKEFADRRKQLEEKLAQESALGAWTFEMTTWTVDSLLKARRELLEEKPAEPANPTEPPASEPTAPPDVFAPPPGN
jgi:hypothetical protein